MPATTPPRPESIDLIGGHPALDLVNTVSWRHDTDRQRENVAVPLDLLTWAHRAAVLDKHHLTAMRLAIAEDPDTAERVLQQVHELREQLYHHLADHIDHPGGEQPIREGSPLHRAFADAVTASSLAGAPPRWILDARDPRDLTRILALQALDLLQTMPRDRLRRCDDDGCGWLFLDTTRNHSRRWCSSRDCGNRARARRHYTRNRTTARGDASSPPGYGKKPTADDRPRGPHEGRADCDATDPLRNIDAVLANAASRRLQAPVRTSRPARTRPTARALGRQLAPQLGDDVLVRTVTLIEAPTSAGAYAPGQEDGPRALLDAGLREGLEAVGVTVHIGGQASPFRWRPDPESPRAANAGAVIDRASQVASLVRSAPAGDTILVLGGDCTVGVGTVAGLLDRSERLGLVYVDRHADLNVPGSTVDGALDWMGVAHMLDIDAAVDGLAALAGQRPMLSAGQISFLGLGPHTDFEAEVIADRRLPVVDVRSTVSDPRRSAQTALSPLAACDSLAVHFDVDLVDFLDAPLAENTDRGTAPSLSACGEILSALLRDERTRALTVTEFNPHHASQDGDTTQRLLRVLIKVLGESE